MGVLGRQVAAMPSTGHGTIRGEAHDVHVKYTLLPSHVIRSYQKARFHNGL